MANTFLAANEPGLAFVCFFGVAVVFCGLVILIGLVYLMNYLCDKFIKAAPQPKQAAAPAPVVSAEIPNREEIVAAVVAAIAEEEKTDISAIRVLSFKKV
jgi:sodium pump decarboxylase gamma subunit